MIRFDMDMEPMSYNALKARQQRKRAQFEALLDAQYDHEDETDSPSLPWIRAIGIACLIVAGLILGYMVYNN